MSSKTGPTWSELVSASRDMTTFFISTALNKLWKDQPHLVYLVYWTYTILLVALIDVFIYLCFDIGLHLANYPVDLLVVFYVVPGAAVVHGVWMTFLYKFKRVNEWKELFC
jgi:hypothetical protein